MTRPDTKPTGIDPISVQLWFTGRQPNTDRKTDRHWLKDNFVSDNGLFHACTNTGVPGETVRERERGRPPRRHQWTGRILAVSICARIGPIYRHFAAIPHRSVDERKNYTLRAARSVIYSVLRRFAWQFNQSAAPAAEWTWCNDIQATGKYLNRCVGTRRDRDGAIYRFSNTAMFISRGIRCRYWEVRTFFPTVAV